MCSSCAKIPVTTVLIIQILHLFQCYQLTPAPARTSCIRQSEHSSVSTTCRQRGILTVQLHLPTHTTTSCMDTSTVCDDIPVTLTLVYMYCRQRRVLTVQLYLPTHTTTASMDTSTVCDDIPVTLTLIYMYKVTRRSTNMFYVYVHTRYTSDTQQATATLFSESSYRWQSQS